MVGFPVRPGRAIVAERSRGAGLMLAAFRRIGCGAAGPKARREWPCIRTGRARAAVGEGGQGLLFHSVRGLPVNNLLALGPS